MVVIGTKLIRQSFEKIYRHFLDFPLQIICHELQHQIKTIDLLFGPVTPSYAESTYILAAQILFLILSTNTNS